MMEFAARQGTNQTLNREFDRAAAENGPHRRGKRLFAFDDLL
jgi:hypothetical protein